MSKLLIFVLKGKSFCQSLLRDLQKYYMLNNSYTIAYPKARAAIMRLIIQLKCQ